MFVGIGEAARLLGVAVVTIRRWARSGKITVAHRSIGGHRRFSMDEVDRVAGRPVVARRTVAYARVSCHDQKDDLRRQQERLKAECLARGWPEIEVIADLGSGLNYRKRGLGRLLDLVLRRAIGRLVVAHKDRLLRFGEELVFDVCRRHGVEVVVLESEEESFDGRLAQDVIELMTVFSATLHGRRSHENRRRKLAPM